MFQKPALSSLKSNGDKYSVQLYPKESCSCASLATCYHILVVQMSIGLVGLRRWTHKWSLKCWVWSWNNGNIPITWSWLFSSSSFIRAFPCIFSQLCWKIDHATFAEYSCPIRLRGAW
jgi:hypothetical protein